MPKDFRERAGTAVRVRDLVKLFGDIRAVDGVGFDLAAEEFFSLLGPSGCGKTTTLRCVAGLESADGGSIAIGEKTVFAADQRLDIPTNRRDIGMVFQSYAVWPHMSVAANILYPLKIRGTSRGDMDQALKRVLSILGMETLADRMPSQLSGGQQQRVALGRALAMDPTVLLLDEPLSNLDAKLRDQMRAELKDVQRRTGLPILYVTHDQSEALALSDRIAVMNGGRVHQLASPTEVYNVPTTRFVLDFIGAVNYLPARITHQDNRQITLDLPSGHTVTIPCPSRVPESRDVYLAIRPEDMTLTPGESDTAAVAAAVPGTIAVRSFLGTHCEYLVSLPGEQSVRIQTAKTVTIDEATPVHVVPLAGLLLDAAQFDSLDAPAA